MDVTRLNELAEMNLNSLPPSENNIKHHIIIPFLESFGHKNIELEHAAQGSRIDINIGNKIIIETKALNQSLDNHVQQLSYYCGREWPVLAILTNGKQFCIYSPQWRQKAKFREKIIYAFDIIEIKNSKLQERLRYILGHDNYMSDEFFNYISKRENEIITVEKQIDDLRGDKKGKISELKVEIDNMKEQLGELNNKINQKEKQLEEIESNDVPEINSLRLEYFIPSILTVSEVLPFGNIQDIHIKGGKKQSLPRGCKVDGIHYNSGSDAVTGLISSRKI